jgi:hypothetical protein
MRKAVAVVSCTVFMKESNMFILPSVGERYVVLAARGP